MALRTRTIEDTVLARAQDPRLVDPRRNDDPIDVGYRDDESVFAAEGDDPVPIDEMFK